MENCPYGSWLSCWPKPADRNIGRCQSVQRAPSNKLEVSAFHRFCKRPSAYPRQPNSSLNCSIKNMANNTGIHHGSDKMSFWGNGASNIRPFTTWPKITPRGKSIKVGRYHIPILNWITLLNNALIPVFPSFRITRNRAARDGPMPPTHCSIFFTVSRVWLGASTP